ncbi:hypothetical protein D3C84_324850 [compost metagenome]
MGNLTVAGDGFRSNNSNFLTLRMVKQLTKPLPLKNCGKGPQEQQVFAFGMTCTNIIRRRTVHGVRQIQDADAFDRHLFDRQQPLASFSRLAGIVDDQYFVMRIKSLLHNTEDTTLHPCQFVAQHQDD